MTDLEELEARIEALSERLDREDMERAAARLDSAERWETQNSLLREIRDLLERQADG